MHTRFFINSYSTSRRFLRKCFGLRTKLGTYAIALFLLKDTLKEQVDDPKFLRRNSQISEREWLRIDDSISEEVTLDDGKLPKGIYKLTQDIAFDEEDAETPDALEGDEVQVFEPTAPDTILGVDVFPVIHMPTQSKIFVSAEDIKSVGIEDLEL